MYGLIFYGLKLKSSDLRRARIRGVGNSRTLADMWVGDDYYVAVNESLIETADSGKMFDPASLVIKPEWITEISDFNEQHNLVSPNPTPQVGWWLMGKCD